MRRMMNRLMGVLWIAGGLGLLLSAAGEAAGAELKLLQPLGRTAYQTNEWIDLAVVRMDAGGLGAGTLECVLSSDDGSRLVARFPVVGAKPEGGDARRTEHVHFNGWLMRPGHYVVEVQADGAKGRTEFDVYSHVRRSSFKVINWGRAQGPAQQAEGEDSLGYNLFYGGYSHDDEGHFIRGGVDFMANCVMSGGHQMDLRSECDWSDPYVTRGGTRRVVRRAFVDRTRPNVQGVHFYDEPGLTWVKHPKTGEVTPHMIPSQVRSYKSAFGVEPLDYSEVKASSPEHAARWREWALWKLGFMDAAWQEAQFGVSYVRPDYLSLTQSQYGWTAFVDGYYFNVSRSLPITSGHGGYDDYGAGYFNPSFTLEMARGRDYSKPCWYLPTWYGNMPTDRMRMEQYLSFMTNVQGIMTPPDLDPYDPQRIQGTQGIVESNQLMSKLGTVFTVLPVKRPPVAVLYSMSNNIHIQTGDMQANYAHANQQGQNLPLVYLAGKSLQHQFATVVEEDILDGTLAAQHRAVILTGLEFLAPEVVTVLEDFVKQGGLVLLTDDCKVAIAGGTKLGLSPRMPDQAQIDQLMKEKKYNELGPYITVGKQFAGAAPLAAALKGEFEKAGIGPVLGCDSPWIAATRQGAGDIEYLFAVNAAYNPEEGGMNAIRGTTAKLTLPSGGAVYDAVRSGPVAELTKGRVAEFRFGPGQMRVFAHTARPIGGLRLATPAVVRDYTKPKDPIVLEVAATLVDDQGGVLSGAAPLEIAVIDALGDIRHRVYRATDLGTCRVTLPLAVNDAPGTWTVVARELLSGSEARTTVAYRTAGQAGAFAGATRRGVSCRGEKENVFRFFRVHHDVSLVVATPAHERAAKRLAEAVRPWGVRCEIVPVEQVNKPRAISDEAAETWSGLEYGKMDENHRKNPVQVGFAIDGPAVLFGTPDENPIVATIEKTRFLPYALMKGEFPGRGRGYVAWQRDAIGPGQESLVLMAEDETGLAEAVGTVYEMLAGLDPLTPFALPVRTEVSPAKSPRGAAGLKMVASAVLPDRVVGMKAQGEGLEVLTVDGTLATVDGRGKVSDLKTIAAGNVLARAKDLQVAADEVSLAMAKKTVPSNRLLKLTAPSGGKLAVGYWGGEVRVLDGEGKVLAQEQLPQDVTGLTWLGNRVAAGLADGRVLLLEVGGG